MNIDEINSQINIYVSKNLTPTDIERAYVSEKYAVIRGLLGEACFQTGSYARFTSISPVHDLDIIYPVSDRHVQDDPSGIINLMQSMLQKGLSDQPVKSIVVQTHSITIEFLDSPKGGFSIDVVPAVELGIKNEFGDSIYMVPEILRFSKENRISLYKMASSHPIKWIRSDPKGYIKAAGNLNETNSDFRHSAKLLKGWRHACKSVYGDLFKLKSFHIEQICYQYFIEHNMNMTLDGAIDCIAALPNYLEDPQFPDRADMTKFIDEYVNELSPNEIQLILKLQSDALNIVRFLYEATALKDVDEKLDSLLGMKKTNIYSPVPVLTSGKSPWAN